MNLEKKCRKSFSIQLMDKMKFLFMFEAFYTLRNQIKSLLLLQLGLKLIIKICLYCQRFVDSINTTNKKSNVFSFFLIFFALTIIYL